MDEQTNGDLMAAAPPQTIRVRYNHEDIELPYEEAVRLIQKGMNYDKMAGQMNEMKNDGTLQMIDAVAEQYGLTRAEIVNKWISDMEERRALEFAQEKGLGADKVMEMLKAQKATESEKDKRAEAAQAEILDRMGAEEDEFRAAYPDISDDDVPDAVLAEWGQGHTVKARLPGV